jgi:hypothetical protein
MASKIKPKKCSLLREHREKENVLPWEDISE